MKSFRALKNLFNPYGNCEFAAFMLCKKQNVSITKTTIQKQLEEHPNYPSLLSISDVLRNVGVYSVGIKTNSERLKNFPLPLIAQIRMGSEKYFTVVSEVGPDSVIFFHPLEKKIDKITFESFECLEY